MLPEERAESLLKRFRDTVLRDDEAEAFQSDCAAEIRAHGRMEYRRGLEDAALLSIEWYGDPLLARNIRALADKAGREG